MKFVSKFFGIISLLILLSACSQPSTMSTNTTSDTSENSSGSNNSNESTESEDDLDDDDNLDDDFEEEKDAIVEALRSAVEAALSEVPDPYLIGWSYSISAVGLTEDQWASLNVKEMFVDYVVDEEFLYDVANPYRSADTPTTVVCHVGKVGDFADPFAQASTVEASRNSATHYHKSPEDLVYSSESITIHLSSIITSSYEILFEEEVSIEGWENISAYIEFDRLGPGSSPEQTNYKEGDLVRENIIHMDNLPQGDYRIMLLRHDEEFEMELFSDYVFLEDESEAFEIKGTNTVSGTVYMETDNSNEPLSGAVVQFEPRLYDIGVDVNNLTTISNEDGYYEVSNVPYGSYYILVDGVQRGKLILNDQENLFYPNTDLFVPLNLFNIEMEIKTYASTFRVTFNNVLIDETITAPHMFYPNTYNILPEMEVYPDSIEVIDSLYEGMSMETDGYFSIFKTDGDASGLIKPNAFYFDWMINIDWLESGQYVEMEFDSQNIPLFSEDPYSGELDRDAFKLLLREGTTFIHHHVIEDVVDTTITITPAK